MLPRTWLAFKDHCKGKRHGFKIHNEFKIVSKIACQRFLLACAGDAFVEGYVLIVEVTTRHVRSHLVNNMGRIAFSSERMLKATTRFAERPYIVELDPVYVWNSICECINDCARWAGPEKVKCVAATSQRFATTIIDRKGETKAICSNVDARGVEVSDVLSGHMGDEAFKVTGHYPPFLFSAYRLM